MTLPEIAKDNQDYRQALNLIKRHITEASTQQNMDLHEAVSIICHVARRHGRLLDAGTVPDVLAYEARLPDFDTFLVGKGFAFHGVSNIKWDLYRNQDGDAVRIDVLTNAWIYYSGDDEAASGAGDDIEGESGFENLQAYFAAGRPI